MEVQRIALTLKHGITWSALNRALSPWPARTCSQETNKQTQALVLRHSLDVRKSHFHRRYSAASHPSLDNDQPLHYDLESKKALTKLCFRATATTTIITALNHTHLILIPTTSHLSFTHT